MALDTYANFQAAIADHLIRTDLTSQIVDCITLFEAEASQELFRNRLIEVELVLIPSAPAAVNVTGAVDAGDGTIQLTVDSTASIPFDGDLVTIENVEGTTEANGLWNTLFTSGATTVILVGSTFTNTYTSGGTMQGVQGRCMLPADFIGWRRVTAVGSTNFDLTYVTPGVFAEVFPTDVATAGTSRSFTIGATYGGSALFVHPGSVTRLILNYFAATPALSGSLNWLFTNRVDAYWNGVLEQIYRYTKDYDQASVYQQAKSAIFDQIKRRQFREAGALAIRVAGSSYGQTP